jgi:hypothetical protein
MAWDRGILWGKTMLMHSNDKDFAILVESIKQAGQIKRGELEPGRKFEFSPLDIKAIRRLASLSVGLA